MAALQRICDALGLDYAGVDFGLAANGHLLLFEANATMVIAVPDSSERWAYRRTGINRIIDAVVAMILQKSVAPKRIRV
jgi:glutathione synthase/RimK-type ligase-like ATP-grasp enzyme